MDTKMKVRLKKKRDVSMNKTWEVINEPGWRRQESSMQLG